MLDSCNIFCMYTSHTCTRSYIELSVSPFSSRLFQSFDYINVLVKRDYLCPKSRVQIGALAEASSPFSLLSFICFFPFSFRSDLPVSHSDAEALYRIHRIKYMYISRYTSCLDALILNRKSVLTRRKSVVELSRLGRSIDQV